MHMKVIVPVQKMQTEAYYIANSFREAKYLAIYNTVTASICYVAPSDFGEDHVDFSYSLKNAGITAIITHTLSSMALGLFKKAGFTVYKAKASDVSENITLLKQNALAPFTRSNVTQKTGCNSLCGSCHSTCG